MTEDNRAVKVPTARFEEEKACSDPDFDYMGGSDENAAEDEKEKQAAEKEEKTDQ